jgi:Cu2+-exporting ATPase
MGEAANSLEQATATRGESCFHCGLPVPDIEEIPSLEVHGKERHFCCHGCEAVCKAILDAGLDDYYRHRTDPAATAGVDIIPEFLKQVGLYDRPEIQKDFVMEGENWREAYLLLENIRCPACLWLNERHLRSLGGVIDVHIDDVTQRARVRWNPDKIRLSEILTAITDIGYVAHPYDASRSQALQEQRKRRSTERLIFSGAIGMLVMNFSLATYVMTPEGEGGLPLWITIGRWTGLGLTAMILMYSAQDFFAGAWQDIRNRRLGMDIPVVLGLMVAWFGSLYTTITEHGEVYFDSIAMFVFFLLMARRLELRGKLRAAGRLEELARVTPRTALRIDAQGERHKVTVDELTPGDVIRLKPGETLAVDGVVLKGISSFDESLLTGESMPQLREPGDKVVAGSVNGEQSVDIEVTHTVQASAVSEIRHLVEGGLEQRPRYALLAERAATVFIAVILMIAGSTGLYWWFNDPSQALPSTIAVLIVTCPCALALATPMALSVSAGRFIDLGVLPLRMKALDALALARQFIFDKTGTLTAGKPALADVIATGQLSAQQARSIAAALAADSEHPVARALQSESGDLAAVDSRMNVPGAGTRGFIDGSEWRLGKAEFAIELGSSNSNLDEQVSHLQADGHIVSLLANSEGVQAIFALNDQLRPGVDAMLAGLKELDADSFTILSGDSRANVLRMGDRLGIDEALGGMSPADKFQWTKERQATGSKVAMFGDGINDAPTLALADASVSFADATDLANNSSDFLILGDNPSVLADARRLARKTRRNIMQNFGWAAGYNLLAIPFAAAGVIPPWGAAIGMSLSSLVVVINALRLQKA